MPSVVQAGIDSLAAVELRNSIASKFAVTLPATLIFDYPTLSGMAAFVFEALGGQRSTRIPLQVRATHCSVCIFRQTAKSSAAATLHLAYRPFWSRVSYLVQYCYHLQSCHVQSKTFATWSVLCSQTKSCAAFLQAEPYAERPAGGVVTRVIGLAARYPTAAGCQHSRGGSAQFWKAMASAANLVSQVPLERWDIDRTYSPDLNSGKM